MSELGIKALDKYKLQVELEKPVPYINELLALNTLILKILKLPKIWRKYGTKAHRAVYNGPFKVINWQVEDKIQLVKMTSIGIKEC